MGWKEGSEGEGGGRELSRELKEPKLDGMISENCHWCRKMGREGGREAGKKIGEIREGMEGGGKCMAREKKGKAVLAYRREK